MNGWDNPGSVLLGCLVRVTWDADFGYLIGEQKHRDTEFVDVFFIGRDPQ